MPTLRASRCVHRAFGARAQSPLTRLHMQVIGEIAVLLKALLQKRGDEFVEFMTASFFPSIACPPEASAQFMTALQEAPECVPLLSVISHAGGSRLIGPTFRPAAASSLKSSSATGSGPVEDRRGNADRVDTILFPTCRDCGRRDNPVGRNVAGGILAS